MAKPVLILFTRAPRLGTVKRRLARDIGTVPALRLYRHLLGRTLRRLTPIRGIVKIILRTPDRAYLAHPPGWDTLNQGHGDLGARMLAAFRRFPGRQVVLIGADIPDLTAADIRAAIRALKHHHAVFGPALDGGFYLVGMGSLRPPTPFALARWSSPHAMADTLLNFRHLRVATLRPLIDIDSAADLALSSNRNRFAG
ncbi:MAG: TIGR04282 family arsenosugar biosynthesis glycosyltransferase [Acidocella sp.]|nr:TIGR04282 family arsenosugar biosynthesis glycosyltransferase [Acidocella sp.]